MKLATLAFEVAKDSIQFPSGFNFDGFIRGDYDNDRDFSEQISFAFAHINLALSRLLTGRKTLLKMTKTYSNEVGYIEFTGGEVVSVLSDISDRYYRVHFRKFDSGIAIEPPYIGKVVWVEYRPAIPRFTLSSIRSEVEDEDDSDIVIYEEVEVNLEDYGITDEMCSYVKEYACGRLMEYISPDLSNAHVQLAETYFGTLKTRHTDFPQREVIDHRVGEDCF